MNDVFLLRPEILVLYFQPITHFFFTPATLALYFGFGDLHFLYACAPQAAEKNFPFPVIFFEKERKSFAFL